ncbi:MAG: cytochrome c4 [Gammaproteobacteria bacterium HGW-Gammaproteobacteria-6]|nr:MAG: cytochrome c4 [Gammaproteobacteria bacterium HGW-Gammaproteobacteria-6]
MRASRLSLLGLCVALTSSVFAFEPLPLAQHGGVSQVMLTCTGCHGEALMGVAAAGFPRLAGLSADYLSKQLYDFKAGKRFNPYMQQFAAGLSDQDIQSVTRFFAALPTTQYARPSRASAAEDLGARLALRGAWERNIPECVSCHGPGGVGVGNTFPPLAGQPALYLVNQLRDWQKGVRRNDPNDLMGHIAKALNEEEIQAVSDYFAGLPVGGAR